MAAIDTTRPAFGSASVANRGFSFLARATAAVVAWNDARVTRQSLNALSDRELEDIGLIRGDIDIVATSKTF